MKHNLLIIINTCFTCARVNEQNCNMNKVVAHRRSRFYRLVYRLLYSTRVFRKHSKLTAQKPLVSSSGITDVFRIKPNCYTWIAIPVFLSPPPPSLLLFVPFIFLSSRRSFFLFPRSLRLALIPYLIGSDLINFSENAIKRPPRLVLTPRSATIYLHSLLRARNPSATLPI